MTRKSDDETAAGLCEVTEGSTDDGGWFACVGAGGKEAEIWGVWGGVCVCVCVV